MRPPTTFPPGWKPRWMPSRPWVFYTAVVAVALAAVVGVALLIHTTTVVRTTSDYAGMLALTAMMAVILSLPASQALKLGAVIYGHSDGLSHRRS